MHGGGTDFDGPGGAEPGVDEPATLGALSEREPNDDRPNATPLPINGALRAALVTPEGGGQDEDWFVLKLAGTHSQQVRMQLSPEDDTDYELHWMPATGEPAPEPKRKRRRRRAPKGPRTLASVDNAGEGGVEVLPPMVLPPGDHYFRVTFNPPKKRRGADPYERPYRLTTTVVDPDGRVEQEPNDDRDTAGVLRPGEPRDGYLGWHRDADWYRLDLEGAEPGSVIRVDVTGVPGVKTRLWMVDRHGRSMVKVPEAKVSWEEGRPVTIRDVGLPDKEGPYFVEVRTMRSSNPHERYTITASLEAADGFREKEPNWRPQNATPLDSENPVDGYIGHPTDWDTFRLDAQDPMVATVVVSGVPGVDLRLELIDASMKVVGNVNEAGAGAPETLPLVQVGPQPAYVRISSQDHTFHVDKSYRIAATLTEAGDREIEPNDGFGDAGRVVLPLGRSFEGLVHPRGDIDYYALDVSAPAPDETRTLTLALTGVDGMTLGLYLYDAERALITRKVGVGGGDRRTITHGFTPGRYFVAVRADSQDAADAESSYRIQVTEQQ